MLNAMILSSRNSLSVRIYRPLIRSKMITKANPVHHHDTSSVGLSCSDVCAGGGLEYRRRSRAIVEAYAHRPPQRGERVVEALRSVMRACLPVGVLVFVTSSIWCGIRSRGPCALLPRLICRGPLVFPRQARQDDDCSESSRDGQ